MGSVPCGIPHLLRRLGQGIPSAVFREGLRHVARESGGSTDVQWKRSMRRKGRRNTKSASGASSSASSRATRRARVARRHRGQFGGVVGDDADNRMDEPLDRESAPGGDERSVTLEPEPQAHPFGLVRTVHVHDHDAALLLVAEGGQGRGQDPSFAVGKGFHPRIVRRSQAVWSHKVPSRRSRISPWTTIA